MNTRIPKRFLNSEMKVVGNLFLVKYENPLPRPIHTHKKDPPLTDLLDVFHDEVSDDVHCFLLSHSVNRRTEGVQRTDTHDDVHDGMVVDSGPSVDTVKTVATSSCVDSLIFPKFLLSMNLSSFGRSLVVKKVWYDNVQI
jgi:hypothetical protein